MSDDSGAVLEKLSGRRVVASISGGKDSAAVSLWLSENGVEHERVFADTGWEHPATMEYLRGSLSKKLGVITELRGERLMEELILSKAMFPSRKRRYCTQELKVFPIRDHINALTDSGEDVVNAVGMRAEESAERAKLKEWEFVKGFDCDVWRPLLSWSLDAVVAIHQRHRLLPNPLYLKGASRVGCWPCINARKAEIRLIADTDPERIARIRVLEFRVGTEAEKRYWRDKAKWDTSPDPEPSFTDEKRHQAWEDKRDRLARPFSAPAFFQAKLEGPDGRRECWPIDKVVEWSRTSRGGVQFEMFAADPREQGCVTWGLCDLPSKDAA